MLLPHSAACWGLAPCQRRPLPWQALFEEEGWFKGCAEAPASQTRASVTGPLHCANTPCQRLLFQGNGTFCYPEDPKLACSDSLPEAFSVRIHPL